MQLLFAGMKDLSKLVWEDPMTCPTWLLGSLVLELLIEKRLPSDHEVMEKGPEPQRLPGVDRNLSSDTQGQEVPYLAELCHLIFRMRISITISDRDCRN